MTDFDSLTDPRASGWEDKVRELKSRSIKSWLLVSSFQGLAKLPKSARLGLGWLLAKLTPLVVPRRAKIVRRNLELCFPDMSVSDRDALMREHFRALAQTFVDRGVLWFGSVDQVKKLVKVKGFENLKPWLDSERPVMLLAPHFVGLDASASRLTMIGPEGATMYSNQGSELLDALVRLGRARFQIVHLVSRRDGIRALIRFIKQRLPIYYLPDMDFGRRGAVFVPFFGVSAATQTSTAQLAAQFNMAVVPIISAWDPKTGTYCVDIKPALTDMPSEGLDLEAQTARLNERLEGWVRENPSQYYWVHRRFKSRPEGEPSLYQ